MDPGLAWTEWLLVEEAEDDKTKELSELSELGLGAEFSTVAVVDEITGTALTLLCCCCNTLLFLLEAALEVVQYGLVVDIIALLTVTCWPLTGSAVTNTSSSSSSSSLWNVWPVVSLRLLVLTTLAFKVVVEPWLESLGGCHCHHCAILSPYKNYGMILWSV